MSDLDALAELARAVGIAEGYRDAFGRFVTPSPDTKRSILAAFGIASDNDAAIAVSLRAIRTWRDRPIPAAISCLAGSGFSLPFNRPGAAYSYTLVTETGETIEGSVSGDDATIALPPLPSGYHRLTLISARTRFESTLIAAPSECWQPKALADGARLFGFAAQLYGLRSQTNLGVGNFSDATAAAVATARGGASFLGLSPVHALFGADRTKFSPYSPSSRLFLEPLYIDPQRIDGFAGSDAEGLLAESADAIATLRQASLVDYSAAWSIKLRLFEALFALFQARTTDPSDFAAFRAAQGEALESHAVFEALSEHFWKEGRYWLGDWPPAFRDVGSAELVTFRAAHRERIAFHAWLQWIADTQLADAHREAKSAGMAIGLYRDLAVGADRGGSEIWAAPARFAGALSAGAPPDPLGPQGQNWGLPPINPFTLEREGLQAFRALVRANMRHAGAIRIDHAFQLQRLFVIPEGASASDGAYISYPFEAMLAVLRLESHRANSLVIAEDLGTAPDGFSDAIMASGLLSYRVLPFERESDGSFKRPDRYPERALAVLTTHDLPTFRGWWRGLDIDLRQMLGIYDAGTAEREREIRLGDRKQLTTALASEGLVAREEPPEEPPLDQSLRYLSRTPAQLVAIQFEDAAGELNQANLPGLVNGHPNWQRRLSVDLADLTAPGGDLGKLAASVGSEGRGALPGLSRLASPPPRATYRLQFHEGFTFDDARGIVPYLKALGISHVYSSPIHRARPGSTHGYDIVGHDEINPELGGLEGFTRLSDALKENGLGLILDIVPNHMGVGGSDNAWWLSVLEWGELSPHAAAFDVDWDRLGANRKLVVPFLAERYGEALETGALKLAFDPAEGSFSVFHHEHRFPLSPLTYPIILDRALAGAEEPTSHAELIAISETLRDMATANSGKSERLRDDAERLKNRIVETVAASQGLGAAIDNAVAYINGVAGTPESFGTLHRILEGQSYRLAHWRVAASEINYRRFFDINSLAGLSVENDNVFAAAHKLVFELIAEGRIQGLRIDHVDGLADPEGYLKKLQASVGPGFYVVVEKILEPGEILRPWPIAGTTGYEALNALDGVFVQRSARERFDRIYRDHLGGSADYGKGLRRAKNEIVSTSFASELEVLVSDLKRIADSNRRTRDFTTYGIRRALIEIVARFPVYRSYLAEGSAQLADIRLIENSVARAKRSSALPDLTVHDFAAAALLGTLPAGGVGQADPADLARFRRRFQQLTGPVMAKSLEDTLFYRDVRFLALNEVGGAPEHFGCPVEAFHEDNLARYRDWPQAMIATATHDTKRGEDARARLLALSEMPETWAGALGSWRRLVAPFLTEIESEPAPDANDQYLLLQAILGAWPMEMMEEEPKQAAVEGFRERIEAYAMKALREAKRHTSWVHGNEAYEAAMRKMIAGLLTPDGFFLSEFRPLARRLAILGMLNGLSRLVLKCTLPGVPDFYQGTEFWDCSLVDPDNRRPVDYVGRAAVLDHRQRLDDLLAAWPDGRIKQRVMAALLFDRASQPALYASGDYRPFAAAGPRAAHVIGFQRRYRGQSLVVVVARHFADLTDGAGGQESEGWTGTSLPIPTAAYRSILDGRTVNIGKAGVDLSELFSALPIAVLRANA